MLANEQGKVSVHGGHSGQFCTHAKDSLEDVIQAYIAEGFTWVGITEHMPPLADAMRYPDEVDAQLSSTEMLQRFEDYFQLCRTLQKKYAGQIEIMTCFETETYAGSSAYVKELVNKVKPDYLVGSVHHVAGIGIDYDLAMYQQAIAACGSIEQMYCEYFDAQYEMLKDLNPAVVGHFDLIRIFDEGYLSRLQQAEIWLRVERNLELIAKQSLILDFNLRGFDKAIEQYPCMPVLKKAISLGISIVPGDDSHGVSSVGRNYDKGIEVLTSLGVSGDWAKPARLLT